MNYEAKRIRVLALLAKAEGNTDWYEAKTIKSIVATADYASKVDIRHANGILDRLLKSEPCMHLIEQEENEKNAK
jgi:hypothetical protein